MADSAFSNVKISNESSNNILVYVGSYGDNAEFLPFGDSRVVIKKILGFRNHGSL